MIGLSLDGAKLRCEVRIEGIGVYLDTDAIIELATGAKVRRERLVSLIRQHGTLLLSITHATELGALQGRSAGLVMAFLRSVGAHWAPFDMNVVQVVTRERQQSGGPISNWFVDRYILQRLRDLSAKAKIIDLSSEAFFDLSAVVAWSQKRRGSLRATMTRYGLSLRDGVFRFREAFERDASSLDRMLPPVPFRPERRAEYVLNHLMRTLVKEARSRHLGENDGMDLSHAVLAVAFARVATLDKAWKRRVETLPAMPQLARVFYRPQVGMLVDYLEELSTAERQPSVTTRSLGPP